MTEDQKNAQALKVVQEHSDNEMSIKALRCHLRRIGELMKKHGPQLVDSLDQANPNDFDELAEVKSALEQLDKALDKRRRLEVDLREMGLSGLASD